MKVLLLGDFSSLYSNLRSGLRQLGHEAVVASGGDGWKETQRDIHLYSGRGNVIHGIRKCLSPITNICKLSGFDVVQYINPFYFYSGAFPNRLLIKMLMHRNERFFLSAAGDDAFFLRYARQRLSYTHLDGQSEHDLKNARHFMEEDRSFLFNDWLVQASDGVIPIMYEYEKCYEGCAKRMRTIPIPIDANEIRYTENEPGRKLVVFHGLNRYGSKGTRHVEEAFRILSDRYPNDLSLIIKGGMPLTQYLKLMATVNVVVDQTSSYSLGVNGLYAMAMGKIVLGGAEPESVRATGATSTPAMNILPSSSSIVERVEWLLENRAQIPQIGHSSRDFVERYHNHIDIARKYVNVWSPS